MTVPLYDISTFCANVLILYCPTLVTFLVDRMVHFYLHSIVFLGRLWQPSCLFSITC